MVMRNVAGKSGQSLIRTVLGFFSETWPILWSAGALSNALTEYG
jgi:hypothetical protein